MDYLAIIRKADFVDLFKYGKLNVYSAIDFDGNIKAHANDDDLFEKLTKSMNLFEYSFEYMVIHFVSDNGNEYPYPINIEDVRGLYTFDEEAKKEMNVSFDSRIRLHVSPWGEKFKALHNNQLMSQSKRGIDNLWAIFDLSETERYVNLLLPMISFSKYLMNCFHINARQENNLYGRIFYDMNAIAFILKIRKGIFVIISM